MAWFETVTDPAAGAAVLRRRRYGVIDIRDQRLAGIHLRPWPKVVGWPDLRVLGPWLHRRRPGNRCLLYYNQPLRCRNFLALKYMQSFRGTTLATFQLALRVLDEVARLKGADALLTDVANLRISDRTMRRYGWEPHAPSRWHRNYIKRFYGCYPPPLELVDGQPIEMAESAALIG